MEINENPSAHRSSFLRFYNFISTSEGTSIAKCIACDDNFHNDERTIRFHVNTSEHIKKLATLIEDKLQKSGSVPQLLMDPKYFAIHKIILIDEKVLFCVVCMQKLNIDTNSNEVNVLTVAADEHIRSSPKHCEHMISTLENQFARGLLQFDIMSLVKLPSDDNDIWRNNVSRKGSQKDFNHGTSLIEFNPSVQNKEPTSSTNYKTICKEVSERTKIEENIQCGALQKDIYNSEIMPGFVKNIEKIKQCNKAASPTITDFVVQKDSPGGLLVDIDCFVDIKKISNEQKPNIESELILDNRNYDMYKANLSKFDDFFVNDIDFISTLCDPNLKALSIEFANMLSENKIFPYGTSERVCNVCYVKLSRHNLKDHLLRNSHFEKVKLLQKQSPKLAESFSTKSQSLTHQSVEDSENHLRSLHKIINNYWKHTMTELKYELEQIWKYEYALAVSKYDNCQQSFRSHVSQLKSKYSEWIIKIYPDEKLQSDDSDDMYGDVRELNLLEESKLKPLTITKSKTLDSKEKNKFDKPVLEKSVASFFQEVSKPYAQPEQNLKSNNGFTNEEHNEYEEIFCRHKIEFLGGTKYQCGICNVEISSSQNCMVHIRGKSHISKMASSTKIECSEGVSKLTAPKQCNTAFKPNEITSYKMFGQTMILKTNTKDELESNYKKPPKNIRWDSEFRHSVSSLPNVPNSEIDKFKKPTSQSQPRRLHLLPSEEPPSNYFQSHRKEPEPAPPPELDMLSEKRSTLLQTHHIFHLIDGYMCKLCSYKMAVMTDVIDHILTPSHKDNLKRERI